jgi:hypothetical protein
MEIKYPSLTGLTSFGSEIDAVSLCEDESTCLVQLRSSSKHFVPLPVQVLQLPDGETVHRPTERGNPSKLPESSSPAIQNSICVSNPWEIQLQRGESLTGGIPKYRGRSLASVRLDGEVRLDLESATSEHPDHGKTEQSVQITALPRQITHHMAYAHAQGAIALHMPTCKTDTVQVVLHKRAELSYPVSSTTSHQANRLTLPLIVERDTAAIRARNAKASRSRLLTWGLGGDPPEQGTVG